MKSHLSRKHAAEAQNSEALPAIRGRKDLNTVDISGHIAMLGTQEPGPGLPCLC